MQPLSPLAIELHACEAHAIRMLDCHVAQDPALLTERLPLKVNNKIKLILLLILLKVFLNKCNDIYKFKDYRL
jgi:hypothetical protein